MIRLPVLPDEMSVDERRRERSCDRRHRAVRSKTLPARLISKRELDRGRELYPDTGEPRPIVRAECVDGPRPCPYVSCIHHLYLDVDPRTGSIKFCFPDLEPEELEESCALDVAERGGSTREEVGKAMNVTRARIGQIEEIAMAKLRAVDGFVDFAEAVLRS